MLSESQELTQMSRLGEDELVPLEPAMEALRTCYMEASTFGVRGQRKLKSRGF